MNIYRATPNTIPWPPIITAAAIMFSILLGLFYAPSLPDLALVRLFGAGLTVTAIYLVGWAIVTLVTAQTTVLSHRKSDHLVTAGPFTVTRNPVCLGQLMLVTGLGLVTTNGWFLIFAVVTGICTYRLGIRREELHLLARFGAEYEFYCRRVRRWI